MAWYNTQTHTQFWAKTHWLNRRYHEKWKFPFICENIRAVKNFKLCSSTSE